MAKSDDCECGACLRHRVDKLEKFKAYVHERLDKAGVPHDPDPTKTATTGCRIEGRLNYVLGVHGAFTSVTNRTVLGLLDQARALLGGNDAP